MDNQNAEEIMNDQEIINYILKPIMNVFIFILSLTFIILFLGPISLKFNIFDLSVIVVCIALYLMSISYFSILLSSLKLKKFVICFGILLTPLFVIGLNYNNIKTSTIKSRYELIDEKLIESYSEIVNTEMYKNFLIDKENRNLKALEMYRNNMDNYLSVTSEQAMILKLFYTSVNNEQIKSNLNIIFKDNLITKNEFADFQNFVYSLDLTATELSMIALLYK